MVQTVRRFCLNPSSVSAQEEAQWPNVLPKIMGRSLQRPGAQEATYRLRADSDCTSKFRDAVNYHYLHPVTVCIGVQTE